MDHSCAWKQAIPFETRCLLVVAGYLLPLESRGDWLNEWFAETWHWLEEQSQQGLPFKAARPALFRRALGGFVDAWFVVRSEERGRKRLKEAGETASISIGSLAVLLMLLAVPTSWFQGTRDLLRTLFQRQSGPVILVSQPVPFMGGNARLPQDQADFWRARSRTVDTLGKWVIQERTPTFSGKYVSRWRVLKGDRSAVGLLGYRLSEGRWPAETRDRCELLSAGEGNKRARGKGDIELDGRRCRVVGVLEPTDLTTAPPFELYEPMETTSLPTHVGLIARLKPECTVGQAQNELLATARLRKGWGYAHAQSTASVRGGALETMGWVFPLLLLVSASSVRAKTARAWIPALLQIGLVFMLLILTWLEFLARAPISETASLPIPWGAGAYFFPLGAGAWAVWWLRREQTSRCRVCHRRVSSAISVGSTGSSLFNPGGVEYICRLGHGALVLGPAAGTEGGEVWVSL